MSDFDDSDQNETEPLLERRRGISSLIKIEEDALDKLDSLEKRMYRMEKYMALITRDVKQLQRGLFWFCGVIGAVFVTALAQLVIHK